MASQDKLSPEEKDFLQSEISRTQQYNEIVGSSAEVLAGLKNPVPWNTIYNQVLIVDTSSITATIPSNVRHLFCIGCARSTIAASSDNYSGSLNGDTGANQYRFDGEGGRNGTQVANQSKTQSVFTLGEVAGSTATAGAGGAFFVFFPNISAKSLWQGILSISSQPEFSSTVMSALMFGNHWLSSAGVQTINISTIGDSLATGSIISIYGIS